MMLAKALLLVEDDAMRRAISFALEAEGFAAQICGTCGNLADDLVGGCDSQPACLVVDLGPGAAAEGIEVLRTARRKGSDLPAIVLVTAPSQNLRRTITTLDAVILEKPLLSGQLVSTVRALTCSEAGNLP